MVRKAMKKGKYCCGKGILMCSLGIIILGGLLLYGLSLGASLVILGALGIIKAAIHMVKCKC